MKNTKDLPTIISHVGLAFLTVLMLALSLYNNNLTTQIVENIDNNIKIPEGTQ